MSYPMQGPPGWYQDGAGGTAYWDGSRMTGHTRPPRRTFAAEAHGRLGLLWVATGLWLPIYGFTSLWTPDRSLRALLQEEQDGAASSTVDHLHKSVTSMGTFFDGLLTFSVALVAGITLVIYGAWLLRGRGPKTKSVLAQLAVERRASRAAFRSRTAAEQRAHKAWHPPSSPTLQRPGFWRTAAPVIGEVIGVAASVYNDNATVKARKLQELEGLRRNQQITRQEFLERKARLLGGS